ncbi:MAG: SLBB domain-containing protein [Patescibacteria group bacterium]|jgi:competence protein ComEA
MRNFFQSFLPLLKKLKLKKYFVEIFLLSLASLITVVALNIYLNNEKNNLKVTKTSQTYSSSANMIFIDVSGAVKKPGVYEFKVGTRIKEAIDKAGGLSDEVDAVFFKRNFNLARIISDQEKIYVPSVTEINEGIFIQNLRTLDYVSPVLGVIDNTAVVDTLIDNQLISLNSATIEELDQLPGIGQITANKIIINRPYSSIEELLIKKAVNKNVFEKIKNLISI